MNAGPEALLRFASEELLPLWQSGGWLMLPLAAVAIYLYYQAFALYAHLWKLSAGLGGKANLGAFVRNPEQIPARLGSLLRYPLDAANEEHVRARFEEVRHACLPFVDRRLHFIGALVLCAPLLGLLGTIVGMLATFQGLANAGAGQTADLVAKGIAQALVTTQTGLLIAIPGYVFIFLIQRRRNLLAGGLARLESLALRKHATGGGH